MKKTTYSISFRCYFGKNFTTHRQEMPLKDIPKWIEAYIFTHPECRSISVKVYFREEEANARVLEFPVHDVG